MPASSDPPPWLTRLAKRLAAVLETPQRIALFLETFERKSPSVAAVALTYLVEAAWRRRGVSDKVLLDTAMEAVGRSAWSPSHLEQVLASAIQTENELICAMFPGERIENDGADEPLPVPTYHASRPLTLGERKAIAAKPDRRLIELACFDPDPTVIEKLLRNPKVTEKDVLFIAAKRPSTGSVLRCVAQSDKWRIRPAIARALVYNPHTPPRQAVTVLHLLHRRDIVKIADDPKVSSEARRFARALCSL